MIKTNMEVKFTPQQKYRFHASRGQEIQIIAGSQDASVPITITDAGNQSKYIDGTFSTCYTPGQQYPTNQASRFIVPYALKEEIIVGTQPLKIESLITMSEGKPITVLMAEPRAAKNTDNSVRVMAKSPGIVTLSAPVPGEEDVIVHEPQELSEIIEAIAEGVYEFGEMAFEQAEAILNEILDNSIVQSIINNTNSTTFSALTQQNYRRVLSELGLTKVYFKTVRDRKIIVLKGSHAARQYFRQTWMLRSSPKALAFGGVNLAGQRSLTRVNFLFAGGISVLEWLNETQADPEHMVARLDELVVGLGITFLVFMQPHLYQA